MKVRLIGLAVAAVACAAGAENQVWIDGSADKVWSTNAANWDAGVMWTNGNNAVFSGTGGTVLGETIDIAATVTVANVTFLTNNYVIADTNADGSLSFVGGPSVIAVSHASDTAIIGAAIRGGGFTKTGPGTLQLKGTNTYTGVTTVSAGTLKLNFNTPDALGAVGTGNHTVVADGATLDFNGCYVQVVNSTFFGRDEDLIVSGSGVGGLGALVNSGASIVNNGFRGLTLVGNTVIGGSGRIDLRSTGVYCGNGYTLTKIGSCEFAVGCPVTNSPIIINDGIYTIQTDAALGGSDYPTTLNGGKLMSWASHTISERLIVNGGIISVNADKAYTFLLTGNITFNSNAVMQTEWSPTNTLELSGVIDGAAGFTCNGSGFIQISGGANTYSGPTTVNSGTRLRVGKTVGGMGKLGSGAVTNNGTLYANSAVLSAGGVVNKGSLYLNPPTLSVGQIVNVSGTVYGTSVVQAASGVVNASTWNSYSGSFGSSVVTNASGGTLNLYTNQLVYGQFVNGGRLNLWQPMTLSDPVTFNGGTVYVGDTAGTLAFPGTITTVTSAVFDGTNTSATEISGKITGSGGIVRSGGGDCFITSDANDYTGTSVISSGSRLWVGKTVGGTGLLGSGAVTNNGALYANTAVLSAGDVVNNAGGSLYLNPANLSAGRIVNAGTVYGTSVVQAARGVVNSGTWQCYSGSFGDSVFTNASGGTLNLYTNVFTCGSFVNGGTVNILNPMILTNAVTFSGGTVYFGVMSNTLALTGPLTLNSTFALNSALASVIELSGKISGPGGLTRSGDGQCFVTCDSNDYTGPTIINGGKTLWVGKAGLADGRLGSGAITNNGTLYFDSVGAYTNSNGINGSGITAIRYGGLITVNGGVSSISIFNVASGTLTLTNGAFFDVYGAMTVANRSEVNYAPIPTNVTAVVNVNEGCTLRVANVTFGNGNEPSGGTMTGILNQAGGIVRTTGTAAEGNGIRLGHYPAARSFYNMMGGTLIVGGDYDLGCATDGQGWFNMTGGEVFTTRVMLNERDNRTMPGGYGRLTVAGGVLNVGSLNASVGAITNAITVDPYAPYLVEYGGAGGIVRAVTNLYLPLNATLYGTGTNAVTFDTSSFATYQSGNLSGTGGLNKAGSGTLVLSGTNTYAGGTRILEGTVQLAAGCAGPTGMVAFAVSTNGVGGVLASAGDLSLAGMTVAVANPEAVDKSCSYTVASWSGNLTSQFGMSALPWPWYVYYDWAGKTAQLRAAIGTVIRLR